ncbi:hypothetical protein [Salinarimonas ramus]|nr:hypothetical protein [Salinarimonas ramus]
MEETTSSLLARVTGGDRFDEVEPRTSMPEAELIARLRAHFAREEVADVEIDEIENNDVEARLSAIAAAMNEALKAAQLRVDMIEAKAELAERRFNDVEAKLRQATARWQAAEQRAAKAERFLAQFHAMIGACSTIEGRSRSRRHPRQPRVRRGPPERPTRSHASGRSPSRRSCPPRT